MFSRLNSGLASISNFAGRVKTRASNALNRSSKWRWIAAKATKAYDALPTGQKIMDSIPGVSLVTARVGSVVFNAFEFAALLLAVPDGSETTLGILLAIILATTVCKLTIVTRYYNLTRKEEQARANQEDDDSDLDADFEELEELKRKVFAAHPEAEEFFKQFAGEFKEETSVREIIEKICGCYTDNEPSKAGWCHPGIQTDFSHIGYKFSQFLAGLYVTGSSLSGILSFKNLMKLMNKVIRLQYEDSCKSSEKSNTLSIFLVFCAMGMICYSNGKSFLRYNLPAQRDYYKDLFMNRNGDGGWRTIPWPNQVEVYISSALSSFSIFYGNFRLLQVLQNNVLCHPLGEFEVPDPLLKTISIILALDNFFIQTIMTFGAIYNRNRAQLEAKLLKEMVTQLRKVLLEFEEQQNPKIPEPIEMKDFKEAPPVPAQQSIQPFGPGNKNHSLKVAVAGNATSSAIGTYRGIIAIPELVANANLNDNWGMILVGTAGAIIAIRNQANLDVEALKREGLAIQQINEQKEAAAEAKRKPAESKTNLVVQIEMPELKSAAAMTLPTIIIESPAGAHQDNGAGINLDAKHATPAETKLSPVPHSANRHILHAPKKSKQQPQSRSFEVRREYVDPEFVSENPYHAFVDQDEKKPAAIETKDLAATRRRTKSVDTHRFYQRKRENNVRLRQVASGQMLEGMACVGTEWRKA